MKCLFTKIQSNIAIWQYIAIHSNAICNMASTHIVSPLIEIRGAENGELAVPVNNTLVSHTAFLAADTQPCVLMQ